MVRFGKLHINICLLAAVIIAATCVAIQTSLYGMAIRVSLVIILFYIIGQAIRVYVQYRIFPEADEEKGAAENGTPDDNAQPVTTDLFAETVPPVVQTADDDNDFDAYFDDEEAA